MRLSDILRNGSGESIRHLWESTQAAGEMGPLPGGEYVCHIANGELANSRTNETPGYKLTFRVVEGPLSGRQFWHDCWLTPAALPQSKRDLGKLGVVDLEQLERPLPRFIRCRCKLALRRDDDGNERNRLVRFDVIGIDPPELDPFAPATPPGLEPGTPTANGSPDEPDTQQPVEGGERVPF